MKKLINLWKLITSLNPVSVKSLFEHIHEFKNGNSTITGLKHAIHYGKCYFVSSDYDKNGMLDSNKRIKMLDDLLDRYKNPVSRSEFIKSIEELEKGVENANTLGLFSCGMDKNQNKIEAIHYQMAIESLYIIKWATRLYPFIWKRVFLPQS